MPGVLENERPLEVAVIGGGIIGLALVTGLLHRGIHVTLYEKTSSFRPVGAGIGFTPNTLRALQLLHPRAFDAQQKTATANGDPKNPNDWLLYVDGYHGDEEELLFKIYTGYRGFEACLRAHFMAELLEIIPSEVIKFNKNIEQVVDGGDDKRVLMHFGDGTSVEADVVIGCDGIKSRVRKMIIGAHHPAAEPSYSHEYAIRDLVPMDKAIEALGEYKARNRHIHTGPGAHIVTVPVGLGKMVNVVALIADPNDWSDATQLTREGNGEEIAKAFKDFGAPVRKLIKAVLDKNPKPENWGLFDSVDNPTPTFAKGRISVAGDAAHASAPHHGAGAGMGIEDALVLATLLESVTRSRPSISASRAAAIRAALIVYNDIRKERTQWLAESSRVAGQILEWRYPETMMDWEKCQAELAWRSHRIWDHDQNKMLGEAQEHYERLLRDSVNVV